MSLQEEREIDEVTQEVLRHKFDSIADEMETALLRSAYSSIVKEGQDASAAVFDPEGRTIAQAVALPIHLGCLMPAVESIVEAFPPEEMQPGDVYALNDPYDGGTHLPDIIVAKPIFHDGEVIALGASMCHHQDVGGKTPGSCPTDATEIYQEGLRFQPVKLHDAGDPDGTFLELLRRNVRIPDIVTGDLNAQIAACNTAERRIRTVAEEYGRDTFVAAVEQLMDYAEERTRSHLAEIPDGEYSFVEFMDDDGIHHHEPVRMEATVTIDGGEMHVDFSGTADQVDGPINAVPSATISAVYCVARMVTDPDIPTNDGCFEPVSVHMPEGSFVNPNPPAAVNARYPTVKALSELLFGALAKAIPDRIPAAPSRIGSVFYFGGDNADGSQWVYGEVLAGGMGARPTEDGIDVIETDVGNCANTPAEATELEYPIRVLEYDLWEDSGGAGRYRGGLGFVKRYELLDDGVTYTHRSDRHDFQPWGLNGGRAAPSSRTVIKRTSGGEETIPSKSIVELDEGDHIEVYATGGGGHGHPHRRPIDEVESDLRDGKVSPEAAAEYYGVVFDEDGTIDVDATAERRTAPEETDGVTFDRGEHAEELL